MFDIQQGVAIIIAVKKKDEPCGLAEVGHGDLWGDRTGKYKVLEDYGLTDGLFEPLEMMPRYPFVREIGQR